jgi:hypothetical protein
VGAVDQSHWSKDIDCKHILNSLNVCIRSCHCVASSHGLTKISAFTCQGKRIYSTNEKKAQLLTQNSSMKGLLTHCRQGRPACHDRVSWRDRQRDWHHLLWQRQGRRHALTHIGDDHGSYVEVVSLWRRIPESKSTRQAHLQSPLYHNCSTRC